MFTKSITKLLAIVSGLTLATSLWAASGEEIPNLADTFMQEWNSDFNATLSQTQPSQRVTSFSIQGDQKGPSALTMLVASSQNVTKAIRSILKTDVTPLVLSVSTLPLQSTEFRPEDLKFEQAGRIWSPKMNADQMFIFPLGQNREFGGIIEDSEVHQGVILLPGWFNLDNPIKITYRNYIMESMLVNR